MGTKREFLKYQRMVNRLQKQKNKVDLSSYNGVFRRYVNPIITNHHVPITWRYDMNIETNPYFLERLGVNSTFNPGAIYHEGYFYLVVRVEGNDRKSFFALAKSKSGIDRFEFVGTPIEWEDLDLEETNIYDMRLVKHEDGHIYGIYCSERKDLTKIDTSSAIAQVGLVVTDDLMTWKRLPNLKLGSKQQRNVVLHPEFINGKYAFYTRPQAGFIDVGNGGGIGFGYVDDINNPLLKDEIIIDSLQYHTIYELKNGVGPAPLKTEKGWIHFAHGVRNTADGLRYVLYAFACDLDDPTKVIAKPSGYLLAPIKDELIGDVGNVLFTNGAVLKDDTVFLYYASSDCRCHVATSKIVELLDYIFNTPKEVFRSLDAVKQRKSLIEKNQKHLGELYEKY